METIESKGAKTVPLQRCEPGEILAKDVHNKSGQKVVSKDKKITGKILRRLSASGIRRVTVYGEPEETVKPSATTEKKEETKKTPENEIEETDTEYIISGNLTQDFESDKDVVVKGNLKKGAQLKARGNVKIKGDITGSIESETGSIDIQGTVTGKDIKLKSKKLIRVSAVQDAELSIDGKFLARGAVTNSDIDCKGNMIIHHEDLQASLRDSNVRIEGKLLADEIDAKNSEGCQLIFRDPKKRKIIRKKNKIMDEISDLETEVSKLSKIVETVKQLGDKVRQLDPEKKKKLIQHTQRFKTVKEKISRSEQNIENYDIQLEELKKERRYFMRVLNTLRKDTQVTMENTMVQIDEDEWDVKLYKKSMLVIQNAEDDPLNEKEWLLDE